MSNQQDNNALALLEKAIYKAQNTLTESTTFQPFVMLRTDTDNIEVYENKVEDTTESYSLLEEIVTKRIKEGDIDIIAFVVDTVIPDKFVEDISIGIRIHLEEKSQKEKAIGARFLYVPYALCESTAGDRFVKLHTPIPVGFPAEYIV